MSRVHVLVFPLLSAAGCQVEVAVGRPVPRQEIAIVLQTSRRYHMDVKRNVVVLKRDILDDRYESSNWSAGRMEG